MLLAIETSCDESAVAAFDLEAFLREGRFRPEQLVFDLISSQTKLHEVYGGVVPELAAREHSSNLPALLHHALKTSGRTVADIRAIAVTQGPGLKGSLLVGAAFAKALSFSLGVPLIPVNHMEGHIWAGEMNEDGLLCSLPALCLVVSGGHTMLVQIEEFGRYRVVAKTRDDAAGEAFDKVATLLGLPYPGGPALSRAAVGGDNRRFHFPEGVKDDPTSFSFSGLKTAVMRGVAALAPLSVEMGGAGGAGLSEVDKRDLAASVEYTIGTTLVKKTVQAAAQICPRSVILTGGVAANRVLRSLLKEAFPGDSPPLLIPPPKWCTDNAAMIGLVALKKWQHAPERYAGWRPSERSLGPDTGFDLAVMPRFPLTEPAVGPELPGGQKPTVGENAL